MKKARIFLVGTCVMLAGVGVLATKSRFTDFPIQNLYYVDNGGNYYEIGSGTDNSPTLVYYTSGAPASGQATFSVLGVGPYGLYTYDGSTVYPVY